MIRIVGIQRSTNVQEEFILLQNQGSMRQHLRGHGVVTEVALDAGTESSAWHLFSDDVYIPSGAFVMLRSACGEPKWTRTKDGALLYVTFLGRETPAWEGMSGATHVLHIQHSYRECHAPLVGAELRR